MRSLAMTHRPPADRVLERAGARLHYRDEGAGPALVLVHGWLLDLTLWDALLPHLSGTFRVLRMDRRGFGASSGTSSVGNDAADVLALLDELALPRAAIVGMSQGARVALDVARRAPGRVSALVLDGAPAMEGLPGGPWPEETPRDRYRQLLQAEGIEALRRALAPHPLMQPVSADPAARTAVGAMLARYTGADLAAPVARATPPIDFTALRLPVLVLNGERDTPQRLAVGAALARAIPGAVRRLLPAAGHLACIDNAPDYGRALSAFLPPMP
jgi:pimeloyl-ACP methyl ester carboxylesterase